MYPSQCAGSIYGYSNLSNLKGEIMNADSNASWFVNGEDHSRFVSYPFLSSPSFFYSYILFLDLVILLVLMEIMCYMYQPLLRMI